MGGAWNQGQKAKPWTYTVYRLTPLTCPVCFYYTTQYQLPRGGTTHSGLSLHTSNIHQKIIPQTISQSDKIYPSDYLEIRVTNFK